MHWCTDETLMLLSLLPFIGIFFRKIHTWWHKNSSHKCHDDSCNSDHVEHVTEIKYSPAREWDEADQSVIEERYGELVVNKLAINIFLLGVDRVPRVGEFRWFVNSNRNLKALFRGVTFNYDATLESWIKFGVIN